MRATKPTRKYAMMKIQGKRRAVVKARLPRAHVSRLRPTRRTSATFLLMLPQQRIILSLRMVVMFAKIGECFLKSSLVEAGAIAARRGPLIFFQALLTCMVRVRLTMMTLKLSRCTEAV